MSYHLKIILVPLIQASLQIHTSDTQDALKKKKLLYKYILRNLKRKSLAQNLHRQEMQTISRARVCVQ